MRLGFPESKAGGSRIGPSRTIVRLYAVVVVRFPRLENEDLLNGSIEGVLDLRACRSETCERV